MESAQVFLTAPTVRAAGWKGTLAGSKDRACFRRILGILGSATRGHTGVFELASAPLRALLARGFPAGTAGASGAKPGSKGFGARTARISPLR